MSDDDAFERMATDAGAAIPEPAVDNTALGTVVAGARHRRNRRRTLVAMATVIPIAVGVVWATTGCGHSQQVASVDPTTTGDMAQQPCERLTTRSDPRTPIVYVNADATDAQVAQIKAELAASPYVRSSTYLDHALYSQQPGVPRVGPSDDPTLFRLQLTGDLSDSVAGRLQSSIEAMPGVYMVVGLGPSTTGCPQGADTSVTTTTFPPVPTTTGPAGRDRQSDGGADSLGATRTYLQKHEVTMLAACSKPAEAYTRTHAGGPPPTAAASGTPEVNGMEAVTGPKCQTGYVPASELNGANGPVTVAAVRLKPSLDAPIAGYLVGGVSGWTPASDFPKYDPTTLVQAEHDLEAQAPPAGAITRPPSS